MSVAPLDVDASGLVRALDLAAFGLVPPEPDRFVAVLFSTEACSACAPVVRRIAALDDYLDVATFDLGDDDGGGAVAAAAGLSRVPTLVLVDASGAVVRSWVGEPLQGVLERTIAERLA